MTKLATADARCAKCAHTWPQLIHSSANVTLDPTLKERVMSGDIFKFKWLEVDFDMVGQSMMSRKPG